MEEAKTRKPHQIVWKDRREGSVTGVTDVISFDESAILLETALGLLTLKGKELHISRLSLEVGEVDLRGAIDSMTYSGDGSAKTRSLLKRMFQ